ncbi:MAG: VWA domain-containing protein [Candidatus Marinimicrobia bacterium]|nr:VWA domain-containing protein [Candidatus Neomarinimicrobiota bacterium]
MFRFAYPNAFFLILPLAAAFVAALYLQHRKRHALRVGTTQPLKSVQRNYYYKVIVPEVLLLFSALLLVTALARPQRGNVNREIRKKGIDIMLALDISGSMQLNDFKPNRLEASKKVAQNFVAGRNHDRIGLVVFAGESFLQCPLTSDYDIVSELISKMEIAPQSLDGTAIGLAISNCINRLRDTEAKSKVVILLTDGENNAGDVDPMTAAGFAEDFGVRIYTVGMAGSGGMVMSGLFPQRIPPLNERLLKGISEETGGRFYRADSEKELQEVWAAIDALEKTEIDARQFMDWQELYFPYLLAAFIMAVLAYLFKYLLWRPATC